MRQGTIDHDASASGDDVIIGRMTVMRIFSIIVAV